MNNNALEAVKEDRLLDYVLGQNISCLIEWQNTFEDYILEHTWMTVPNEYTYIAKVVEMKRGTGEFNLIKVNYDYEEPARNLSDVECIREGADLREVYLELYSA